MMARVSLLILVLGLLSDARPPTKKDGAKRRREGACLEGWYDSSEVGLGCILPDINHHNINETASETVCSQFGEGGQLVEIFNYDQMHFLRNMIAIIENDNQMGGTYTGDIYWWIGLTDHAEEGTWVWPSGMAGNFTWWDEDYGHILVDW